jgi:hypothetical protein
VKNAYKIFVRNPEQKEPLGRQGIGCEIDIRRGIKERRGVVSTHFT